MKINEFIDKYNSICDKHLKLKSTLPDLTDNELFIWIAGQTYKFGRSIADSLENAKIHMKDRKKAEKSFSYKHEDLLGVTNNV